MYASCMCWQEQQASRIYRQCHHWFPHFQVPVSAIAIKITRACSWSLFLEDSSKMDESTFSSDYVSAGQSVPKSSSDAMLENKSVATIETEIFYPEDGVSVDEGVVMMEDMDGATPVPGPANGSASTDSTIGNDGRMIESGLPVAGGPQTNVGNGACASIGNELCSPSHRNRDDVNKFYFQLIEIIVLSSALLVVIVLFSIPTILFELPESEVCI